MHDDLGKRGGWVRPERLWKCMQTTPTHKHTMNMHADAMDAMQTPCACMHACKPRHGHARMHATPDFTQDFTAHAVFVTANFTVGQVGPATRAQGHRHACKQFHSTRHHRCMPAIKSHRTPPKSLSQCISHNCVAHLTPLRADTLVPFTTIV